MNAASRTAHAAAGAPTRPDIDVLRQAAHWFSLLSEAAVSEQDRLRWHEWLQASPAHQQAWAKVEAIQAQFQPLAAEQACRAAASSALSQRAQRAGRRRAMLRSLLVLCAAGGLAAGASQVAPVRRLASGWRADHQTAVGEIRGVTLPDGSQLWLNTASAIRLAYGDAERRIILLHGEIRVQTAPDPGRPLRVETPYGDLRALGTRFNVRENDADIALAVYEGTVEVRLRRDGAATTGGDENDERIAVVTAGQQLRFNRRMGKIAPLATATEAGWARRRLMADDLPLSAVVDELARYRRGFLSCDPAVAHLRVAGSYPLNDTDMALRMLTMALPIELDTRLPWRTRVVPRRRDK